ncbi:hypothetical protein PG996_000705 [Apiospora saccharicola]|uniref:PLC-like phosphodiesterase n=1 Tax=Apiospora saccharicola TaxID=335842 RepID=A0ABR1WEI6_9PEZI
MVRRLGGLLLLAVAGVSGQSGLESIDDSRTTMTVDLTTTQLITPTGTYLSLGTQRSQGTSLGSMPISGSTSITSNITQVRQSTETDTRTYLTGDATSTIPSNHSTSATSSVLPTFTNTRPCNNWPEFCSRRYSNITEVSCHNSPFITKKNLAANQQYDVTTQLDDGVRFLQAQIQWPANGTKPHFCHTSCDILDAGPMTDWLGQVKDWVVKHPYDVITILLGNGNYSVPSMYVPSIEESGLLPFIYTPPLVPMLLNDWPTLGEMVLSGKRVVMFMDYMANQTEYPWLLDEFSQMWETPFDPVDQKFPCVVQRPPDLSEPDTKNRMSLMNHNLNIEITLLGNQLLVPARTELNVTNNVTGFGSVGEAAQGCKNQWGRAPNFLNVDYYNVGGFDGSVFAAAAKFNNVTYDRPCCGGKANAAPGLYTALDGTLFWVVGLTVGYQVLSGLLV